MQSATKRRVRRAAAAFFPGVRAFLALAKSLT